MDPKVGQVGFNTDAFPEGVNFTDRIALNVARENPGTIDRDARANGTE
jgi:hypothetical protein